MPKLDKLVRELCSDGVQVFRLEEIAHYAKTRIDCKTINEDNYVGVENLLQNKAGKTKATSVPTTGMVIAYQKNDILIGNIRPYLRKVWLADCEGGTNGDVLTVQIKDTEKVLPQFLYYVLSSEKFFLYDIQNSKGAKMPRGSKDAVMKFEIPLPPIEVQREIVRILDNFTNLTAELTAELTARKTQYAYYRDNLLTTKPQWNHVKILDMLSQPITDGPHTTPQFVQNGVPFISVDSIWDGKIHFEKRRGYITEEFDEECCKKYKPQKNDVYMVKSGSTTGKVAFVDTDIRFNIWSPLAAMRVNEKNSARFLFYLLQTERVQKQVKAKSSHGSQPNLGMRELEQFEVDIPPLDVQNRIVNVLDNFEKICSDLNIGLPAEIEARQKQYEYYRDKLLTFAETGNTILSRAEQSRAEQSRAEQSRALIKLLQYVFGYAVVSLQDVVKNSCSGGTPKKGVSEYYEDGNIPWLRTQEVVFRDICKTECFITESAVKNSAAKWIPENCVIVAISGATAGRCAINKIPLTTNQHCLNLEVDPEMALYRYVYYCICAKQEELLVKKEGARGDLNSTRILSLQIDLPSIEEQKRIISILDSFDSICNDLTSGLPAEIEARQKQYEYYRDKLLSFEEKL